MLTQARALQGWLRDRANWPVLTQEMRIRQRGAKPFIVMFIYGLVLIALAGLVLYQMMMVFGRMHTQPDDLARVGRSVFLALMQAQLAMIALAVPAYSAGAVTTERERGTIDLLVLTRLGSSEIVTQKLAAAIGQAIMLIVVSLPVVAAVFLLGGVSPAEVAVAYLVLIMMAMAFGATGMLCSCQFASTKTSTFVAYLGVLLFLVGVPVFGHFIDYISRYGANGSFSYMVVIAYLVGVSPFAFFVYSMTGWIAGRRGWPLWRVRHIRMAFFGISCIMITGLLSTPGVSWVIVNTLYSQSMFLPLYVNPFVAITWLVDVDAFGSGMYRASCWPALATIALGCVTTYVFKCMCAYRFEAMRRRA